MGLTSSIDFRTLIKRDGMFLALGKGSIFGTLKLSDDFFIRRWGLSVGLKPRLEILLLRCVFLSYGCMALNS